jgi:hypothetical protein
MSGDRYINFEIGDIDMGYLGKIESEIWPKLVL